MTPTDGAPPSSRSASDWAASRCASTSSRGSRNGISNDFSARAPGSTSKRSRSITPKARNWSRRPPPGRRRGVAPGGGAGRTVDTRRSAWTGPIRSSATRGDGIERLLNSPSVLLADEMGLGKTIQAIAALRILAARREIERALIVCPVGLIAQWRRQIRIWAPDLPISTAVGPRDQRMAAWRAERDALLFRTSNRSAPISARDPPAHAAHGTWLSSTRRSGSRMPKSDVAAVVKSLERAALLGVDRNAAREPSRRFAFGPRFRRARRIRSPAPWPSAFAA